MPYFFVRTELHAPASGSDYANLHEEMERVGFLRKVLSSTDNKWYALPHALYHGEAEDLNAAKTMAVTAAQKTVVRSKMTFSFELVAMPGLPWTGRGLKETN